VCGEHVSEDSDELCPVHLAADAERDPTPLRLVAS